MAEETSLEQEALKRREKLKALREKSAAAAEGGRGEKRGVSDSSTESESAVKVIKFRNYQPKDEALKEQKLSGAKPLSVEQEVKEHVEKGKSDVVNEVDLSNLAPRKPDWDLKRDVAKKLEKLERRTQRAIIELIRSRLQEEGNLAEVVSAVTTEQGFDAE
ncbi:coiled-coil domain-containing protein 12-like [Xenia sp. Carnegie-2017]|uniref:coiled-coil domain-containing protein 12-like n=1 Tax=Xenia sp. Carnegie-2017 TaxID=2897299 RepID=UPI001F035405|nr:coiled-coil domain-containing protein 12-like [Xenia sp. Carnegie-2017]